MYGKHVQSHGRRRELAPALWLAAAVAALFIGSLLVIVLLLHSLAQLALEIAGHMWPA